MKCKRRRSQREIAALREWNAKADQWDGTAHVWNPHARQYELAEVYQDKIAKPMMNWFDRMPPIIRRRIANSVDGDE